MSRDDGFAIADVNTSLLADPKIRRLAKRLPDDGQLAAAVVVYLQTLLDSWGEGRRLTAADAESWIEATAERVQALQEVGLLDAEARIPEQAWTRWYVPAHERRERAREAGREGNRRRWHANAPRDEQQPPIVAAGACRNCHQPVDAAADAANTRVGHGFIEHQTCPVQA